MAESAHIHLRTTTAQVLVCCTVLALVISAPQAVQAQRSALGYHTINLRLKPSPVADVLSILSARSKVTAKLPEGQRLDEGRAWEVDGADKLDGIVVAVNFVETPVEQLVTQLLGCVGYGYSEVGDRISIEKISETLPVEQCKSVTQVALAEGAVVSSRPSIERQYSFQLESISALDFIKSFSNDTRQNVLIPYEKVDSLKNIKVSVNLADMAETEVLKNFLECIGWKYERTNAGYIASESAESRLRECHGFRIL